MVLVLRPLKTQFTVLLTLIYSNALLNFARQHFVGNFSALLYFASAKNSLVSKICGWSQEVTCLGPWSLLVFMKQQRGAEKC